MRKIVSLSLIALALMGCRTKPAPSDSSVAITYYHPYGFAVPKEEWVNRGQNGKVVCHLKGGSVQSAHYENGLRHGIAEWTYPYTSIVCRTEEYDHGKLVRQTEHYRSGAPKRQSRQVNAHEREVSVWYEEASPQAQEMWHGERLANAKYMDRTGKVEASVEAGSGERIERESDKIFAKEQYADGQCTLRIEFSPSGQVSAKIPYLNGQMHGVVERFSPQNELIATEDYVEGHREGFVTEFLNNQKVSEIPFTRGMRHGQEKRFRDGQLIETVEWQEGKKYGPHRMIVNGQVVKTEYYYFDIPVSKIAFEKMVL